MKGQSSTEQLITYGWAGMIMIVVIGVLLYFGVFSGLNNVPERCLFQNGFFCESHRIYSNAGQLTVNFEAKNKFPKKVIITGILCSAEPADPSLGYPARGFVNIAPGDEVYPESDFSYSTICYSEIGSTEAEIENFEGLIYLRYEEAADSGFGTLISSRMKIANIGGKVNPN